jgi:hypothetical protein
MSVILLDTPRQAAVKVGPTSILTLSLDAGYSSICPSPTGAKYDNEYAAHFVVCDGRITEIHEYFDPIVLQKAFGDQLRRTFNVRP